MTLDGAGKNKEKEKEKESVAKENSIGAREDTTPNGHDHTSCPNPDDDLHLAVREHRKSDVLRILDKDPSAINRFDKHQQTPLHIACSRGYRDLVLLFLQRSANLHAVDKNSWTPLHRFIFPRIRSKKPTTKKKREYSFQYCNK